MTGDDHDGAVESGLLPESIPDVVAGILDLLADLSGGAADPLALSFSLKVRIVRRPAQILLRVALAHHETVPELVHETHEMPPLVAPREHDASRLS
jgi:hypothetical protein